MRISMLLAFVLSACAGGAPDEVKRVKCMKELYDVCNTEHDCASQNCVPFPDDGYQMCTVGCTADTPCPLFYGEPVPCEEGVCKPAMPNDCDPI